MTIIRKLKHSILCFRQMMAVMALAKGVNAFNTLTRSEAINAQIATNERNIQFLKAHFPGLLDRLNGSTAQKSDLIPQLVFLIHTNDYVARFSNKNFIEAFQGTYDQLYNPSNGSLLKLFYLNSSLDALVQIKIMAKEHDDLEHYKTTYGPLENNLLNLVDQQYAMALSKAGLSVTSDYEGTGLAAANLRLIDNDLESARMYLQKHAAKYDPQRILDKESTGATQFWYYNTINAKQQALFIDFITEYFNHSLPHHKPAFKA